MWPHRAHGWRSGDLNFCSAVAALTEQRGGSPEQESYQGKTAGPLELGVPKNLWAEAGLSGHPPRKGEAALMHPRA